METSVKTQLMTSVKMVMSLENVMYLVRVYTRHLLPIDWTLELLINHQTEPVLHFCVHERSHVTISKRNRRILFET